MNSIELKNINQSYGSKTIIKGLDLQIQARPTQSQFVAILGPSGCGKSTLLRYISGLQKPTSGQILLNAQPRTEHDRIGMVFQKYSSLPWLTVIENIELGMEYKKIGAKDKKDKAVQMLSLVELEEHANKYAQYPTLSGGQLQRVAIARSLVANSNILLMDEPFGALDIKTRLKMQDLLLKIKQTSNITILFVTHDISEAVYLADEIVIMGGNPSCIVEKIQVPFGNNRNRELKDNSQYKNLVRKIEEDMMRN